MKIAIYADIHSNYLVFKKAYDNSVNERVDMHFYLGDHITDGFDGNKILDIIKSSNGYAINGNRELSILDYHNDKDSNWNEYIQYFSMKYAYECLNTASIEYINSLPIYKIVEIEGKKICLSHGTPYSVRGRSQKDSYKLFDDLIKDFNCDIYLFGHEHEYYYTDYKDKLFINPGSIGLPTDGLPFKYGILTIDKKTVAYEKIDIDYSYEELETYYKNSDYYNKANIWCTLILRMLKTGINHSELFMEFVYNRAKEKNIKIDELIPNDFFNECFQEYIKANNLNQYEVI